MFIFHTKRKVVISAVVLAITVIPTTFFAINRILTINNTSAIEYIYPIPEGYTTIVDQNFYECAAKEFKTEFPSEEIPTTGLTDEQLGRITRLFCNVNNRPDDEKITDATGLEKMVALKRLWVGNNQLTTLDVSHNTALEDLYANSNQLTALDVSQNTALTYLNAHDNQLASLDVSNNTALTELNAHDNQLTTLDVSNNTALTELNVYHNKLTTLDVSNNIALKALYVSSNQLTTLDVSQNTALKTLSAHDNQLTTLDVSNNTALTELEADDNQLTTLDVSNNTALTMLNAHDNQLTTLDVSNNTALKVLYVSSNQLTSVDVSGATALTYLNAPDNQLTTLDVSHNTALTDLYVSVNQLTTLDVSNNTALIGLDAHDNQLTTLDVSNNIALKVLYVPSNQLTALDVSQNTALKTLSANDNQLTTLDVSNNTALTVLQADDILIKTNMTVSSENPLVFDLSNLGFVGEMNTINDTNNYAYDSDSKLVTMNNLIGSGGYIQTNSSIYHQPDQSYKLQILSYLTYNGNGGSGVPAREYCILDGGSCAITIPTSIPTRNGYSFLGYADTADATIAQYIPEGTITISELENTIYAVWKKLINVYTSISGTGGTISDSQENVEEGSNVTISFYPDEGYELDAVTVNGESRTVSNNSLSLTVGSEDIYVVATFKLKSVNPDDPDDPVNPDDPDDPVNPDDPIDPDGPVDPDDPDDPVNPDDPIDPDGPVDPDDPDDPVNPDDPIDPDGPVDPDDPIDKDDDSDNSNNNNNDDIVVPNTAGDTNNSISAPNTGDNTNNDKNIVSVLTYLLPILAVVIVGSILLRRRSKAHKRFDW